MLSVWKVTLDKMAEVCAISRGVDFCLSQNVFPHQATWIWIIFTNEQLFLNILFGNDFILHEAFTNILAIIGHLYKLEVGTLPPPGQEVERAPAILTSFRTRTSLWPPDQENFWALPRRFNYLEIINSNNPVTCPELPMFSVRDKSTKQRYKFYHWHSTKQVFLVEFDSKHCNFERPPTHQGLLQLYSANQKYKIY